MRHGAAPLRFVAVVIGLWIGGRVLMLTRWSLPSATLVTEASAEPPARLAERAAEQTAAPSPIIPKPPGRLAQADRVASAAMIVAPPPPEPSAGATTVPTVPADGAAPPPMLADLHAPPQASRWTGEAYLFVREGSGGPALAAGGQLGASQVAARLAYALDPALSLVMRGYAPLDTPHAGEGAIGVDFRPLPDMPLRLTLERRFAAGGKGRDAWSAYGAAGFYRTLPRGVEADAYAQAGIVGARRHDLFVDAAVRLAKPVVLDVRRTLRLGIGGWGAAQPGAARLDLGPRAALSLPVARTTVTAAAEYRIRVAGDARPGSGAAFTLSAGF